MVINILYLVFKWWSMRNNLVPLMYLWGQSLQADSYETDFSDKTQNGGMFTWLRFVLQAWNWFKDPISCFSSQISSFTALHWPQVQQEDGRLQQGRIIHLSGQPHMFLICLLILHVFMLFVGWRRLEKMEVELWPLHMLSRTCQQEGARPFCPF